MASKQNKLSAEAVCRQILDEDNSDVEYFFDGSDDDFGGDEIEAASFAVGSTSTSGHDLDIGEDISIPNVRDSTKHVVQIMIHFAVPCYYIRIIS